MNTSGQSQPDGVSAQPPEPRVTRREAIAGAAALAALSGLAGPIGAALGQTSAGGRRPAPAAPAQPATPKSPSPIDHILRKGASADWSLKTFVHLDSFQSVNVLSPTTGPGAGTPDGRPAVEIIPIEFKTAAIVFPVSPKTSTSEGLPGGLSAQIRVDGKAVASTPTWLDDLPGGSRYGKWELRDVTARTIDIDFESRSKSWEVTFDEAAASKIVWPKANRWSADAASSLGAQTIERLSYVDPSAPAVKAALDKWTAGKPPQSIPPIQLAKFLAGRVLETVQPSGNGLMTSRTGLIEGFQLNGPEATLLAGRASEHDIASLLCSFYRAVGLPSRVVIGYDVTKSQGSGAGFARQSQGELRSWVEFCVIDEATNDPKTGKPPQAWIPVDVVRQRNSSSKAPPFDRAWKFFGNNEDGDDIIPMAFHFHPPLTGAVAHGSPCLWGWMTTPVTQVVTQSIRFMASTPARTGAPRPGGGYK
ncbi:MAG TPA: transglutaminase-like domain-containing protein [Phycisphaerales bacterium]|nr:transglutaminase-like domain-containing protein [Phycisphaerales bacterium]